MTKLSNLKAQFMQKAEFRKEYEKADEEFAFLEILLKARAQAKMSQTDIARALGTTQSAIARLEGGKLSPSVATLQRYAEALGAKLEMRLVPRRPLELESSSANRKSQTHVL